jgi:GT2 family glycosyltransferase
MISFVLPTRDRPTRLRQTLLALGRLGRVDGREFQGEVIVVDNASRDTPVLPRTLDNGLTVTLLKRPTNEGAAARNVGVQAADARREWVVLLDDDSYPLDCGFLDVLEAQPTDVAAVSADIVLPGKVDEEGRLWTPREQGGLPEVFIGCGVAIRRRVFLELGGYDPGFNYYVEEYDLAAKVLLAGYRVVFSREFRVVHAKDSGQRDMNTILARLVRNNGWVAQRYAPKEDRMAELREVRRRYRTIAAKEDAMRGYAAGLQELRTTLRSQPRRPMPAEIFDRFTGLAAARTAIRAVLDRSRFRTAAIVDAGKNAWVVERALREAGVALCPYGQDVDAIVIGTMSPGPMLDAVKRRTTARRGRGARVVAPWLEAMPEVSPVVTSQAA